MQFQVLFCEDDGDITYVDGILHDGHSTGAGVPVTLRARADGSRDLAAVLRAQLSTWADAAATVELTEGGNRVVLADGRARVLL